MLVIISDLHLTDGTCGPSTSPGAFEIFAERLREMAEAASWRSNGRYQPISHLDVVLLGDILDPIRSAQWLARPNIRPWQNPHDAEFTDLISKITTDILEHNESGLSVLRGLSADDGLTIPSALRSGKINSDGQRQPVDVRLNYMVGNHDWFYHLPGLKYSTLRKKIVDQMGLANDANDPFPHDAAESDTLLSVMRRHKVTARHGDLFDPINFGGDRNLSSLGDCIVIDLLNRFAVEVARELSEDLSATTILGLREIDNVRPLLMIPVWIDGLLERTCEFPSLRRRVKSVWDRPGRRILGDWFRAATRHLAPLRPCGRPAEDASIQQATSHWLGQFDRNVVEQGPWCRQRFLLSSRSDRTGLPQSPIEVHCLRSQPSCRMCAPRRKLRFRVRAQPGVLQLRHVATNVSTNACSSRAARVHSAGCDDLHGAFPRRRAQRASLRDVDGIAGM